MQNMQRTECGGQNEFERFLQSVNAYVSDASVDDSDA